jgi:hypothetical protein
MLGTHVLLEGNQQQTVATLGAGTHGTGPESITFTSHHPLVHLVVQASYEHLDSRS